MTTLGRPRAVTVKGVPAVDGARLFNRLCAVCLTLFALIWLVPFAWAIATSLRSDGSITQNPTSPFAGGWSLHAYSTAWQAHPIGTWYLNSLVISSLAVVFTVVFVFQRQIVQGVATTGIR